MIVNFRLRSLVQIPQISLAWPSIPINLVPKVSLPIVSSGVGGGVGEESSW